MEWVLALTRELRRVPFWERLFRWGRVRERLYELHEGVLALDIELRAVKDEHGELEKRLVAVRRELKEQKRTCAKLLQTMERKEMCVVVKNG